MQATSCQLVPAAVDYIVSRLTLLNHRCFHTSIYILAIPPVILFCQLFHLNARFIVDPKATVSSNSNSEKPQTIRSSMLPLSMIVLPKGGSLVKHHELHSPLQITLACKAALKPMNAIVSRYLLLQDLLGWRRFQRLYKKGIQHMLLFLYALPPSPMPSIVRHSNS